MKVKCALALGLILLGTQMVNADDWPRFRGPNGSGIASGEKPTPTEWSPDKNVQWKFKINGKGVSSPIVVGDKVVVTSYSGYGINRGNPGNMNDLKRHVTCVNKTTGKQVWTQTVDPVLPEEPFSGMGIPAHGYASHTPVSDGEHVFVFFGRTGVLAFELETGKKIWAVNVGKGESPRGWGSASSPIVFEDSVIVPATAESGAMIALDKKTGKEIWNQAADGFYSSWSTPILSKVDDERTDLVFGVPYEIWGLNPKNGKLKWYAEVIESNSFNSSVVESEGTLYAIEGRRGGGGSVAIKSGGKGDASKNAVWSKSETGSYSSPVVYKNRIYHFSSGIIKCIDAKSGEEIYKSRLPGGANRGGGNSGGRGGRGGFGGGGGADYASPVAANGYLYYVKPDGSTLVVKMGDKFENVATNKVTNDREVFSATPAISDGMIFLRSDAHLYCVGNPQASK